MINTIHDFTTNVYRNKDNNNINKNKNNDK